MTYSFKLISARHLNLGFISEEILEPSSDVFSICIVELNQYYNSFLWDHPHL